MAGNTTKIDEVVDEVAITQFNALKIAGKELRTELSQLLQSAINLNAVLGGSTPASFAKNLQASTDATNKIIANNNKQIENEQKKAAKQEEIVNKYLVLLSKQEAARQQADAKQAQRDAKEIAAAEAKQAKLDAIATRKANVQFPTSSTAPNPITDEPTDPSVRYEPIITGNENMAIAATKSAEAIAGENAALLEQQEVMDGLSTAYRANIELLLTLQIERAENAAAIKALTVEDAASGERMVFLTAEQLRLKTAIQQTNLTLSQQTKQMLAADTSTAQNQARLDELRVAYNNLTVTEQENVAIGGVWLAEIERLDLAVKEAAVSQGIYNKNVGNYTVAADFAEKVSAKFYTQLVRLAAQFILITVIFGAITWLYDWIKNLDIFTGRLDKAKQAWEAWSEVMSDASKESGKTVIQLEVLNKAAQDLNETDKERLAAVKELRNIEGDRIKDLSDEAIMTGALNDRVKELTDNLEKQAIAQAGFKKLTDIESQIIDQKTLQDKLNNVKNAYYAKINSGNINGIGGDLATIPGADKMSKQFQKNIVDNEIKRQIDDSKATLDVLNNTKKTIEDNIGLADLAKAAEGNTKPSKTTKTKDTANTDLLEYNRIKLEESKKVNKVVLDNEENSYDVRKIALDKYLKDSKALIDNSNEIIDADTNLRGQQRINKKLELSNKSKDIDIEAQAELEKINKQEIEKKKKAVADIVTLDKEQQQEQLEALNQGAIVAAQKLNDNKEDLINAKTIEFSKRKISEKQFNRDLLLINDEYNVQRIAQELTVQRAILAIKEATRDKELADAMAKGATPAELAKIASEANKGIDTTGNSIAGLTTQFKSAKTKQTVDAAKSDSGNDKDKRKDLQDALGYAKDVTEDIRDLIDKGYENQISKLEKIGQKIQENADIEKAAIDQSLDTQSNKARREEVLAAETASKQNALQEEIAKEKRKQAIADKAAAIAEIILNTAIAASKVLGQTGIFGIALEPVVIALGALQLAKAVATPIPQFAKGTPTGGHKGGLAVIGEVGPERVTEPGKPAYYSPGVATMVSLPRGTVVEPYKMLPETPKWTSTRTDNSAVVDGLKRVERAVSGQKQGRARVQGWLSEQRQADAWNGYVDRRFK